MLTMLFNQYPGFRGARLIKGRNVAYIEYSDALKAGIAKRGLHGFMINSVLALQISCSLGNTDSGYDAHSVHMMSGVRPPART